MALKSSPSKVQLYPGAGSGSVSSLRAKFANAENLDQRKFDLGTDYAKRSPVNRSFSLNFNKPANLTRPAKVVESVLPSERTILNRNEISKNPNSSTSNSHTEVHSSQPIQTPVYKTHCSLQKTSQYSTSSQNRLSSHSDLSPLHADNNTTLNSDLSPLKTHIEENNNSLSSHKLYTAQVTINMSDTEKYSHIQDIDVLQGKLRDTKDYDERKLIRAAIRNLRERKSAVPQQEDSELPPLDNYTEEEDLKLLLHRCNTYEDKKKVRNAIRELRRRKENTTNESIAEKKVERTPNKNGESSEILTEKTAMTETQPKIRSEESCLLKDSCNSVVESRSETQSHEKTTPGQSDIQEKTTTSQSDLQEQTTSANATIELKTSESMSREKNSQSDALIEETEVCTSVKETNLVKETDSELKTGLLTELKRPELSFAKPLTDTISSDGKRLELFCQISESSPDVHVFWYKDNEKITSCNDITLNFIPPTASLIIGEVLYPDDGGIYKCRIESENQHVETICTVTVSEPVKEASDAVKPEFCVNLRPVRVTDGDKNVTLSCQLKQKNTGVVVSWYKDDKIMKPSTDFKQTFDGIKASLTLSKISHEDEGSYECVAEIGDQESSTTAQITVIKSDSGRIFKRSETGEKTVDKKITSSKMDPAVLKENNNNESKIDNVDTITKSITETQIKDDKQAERKESNEKEVVEISNKRTPAPSLLKTGLKSVGRPGLNQTKMAETSLISRLNATNTQTSNPGSQIKSNTQKSWGNTGATSTRLGKSAPGGARNAMAAFKQMDTTNNPNAGSTPRPNAGVRPSVTQIKQTIIRWCQAQITEYQNVSIDNFSTSWNDGVAFLALIHHFYPDSFAWEKVDPRRRRENFTLAFNIAEKKADIAPLLDVDDMVKMKKPDWKCVFTYVQSFYRKLKDHENNKHTYMVQSAPPTPTE